MTGKKKDILWAFVVGGAFSVITEGLWWLLMAIGVPADSWGPIVMLMVLSLTGMLLTYFGVLQKIVPLAGFGVFLPFVSFPCCIMLDTMEARMKGDSLWKATKKGLKGPAFVFGTGIAITIAVCLIFYAIRGYDASLGMLVASTQIESTPMSLMLYVKAFLVGGLICAVWQILFMLTHKSVVFLMALGVWVGGLLTGFGWMEQIVGFAGRGMVLQIHDTGEAIYRWFTAILLFRNWEGFGRFCLLLSFTFIGSTVIFGELLYKRMLKKGPLPQSGPSSVK